MSAAAAGFSMRGRGGACCLFIQKRAMGGLDPLKYRIPLILLPP
jgi:hypothetical protein